MAYSQASTSKLVMALEKDPRGYPERTFPTRIVPADPSSFTFRGEGKEPYQHVQLQVVPGSEAESSLQQASSALSLSHLVAFPTETVYGLGANALDADAVSKIFKAKGRPVDNPLIVHISDVVMLLRLVPDNYQPSPVYAALMDKFWPGAMTLLVPVDEAKVPSVVRCGLKTLGVRMPSHPVARALIAASGLPLAAPSANASGRPSPTTAMHVYRDMTTKKEGKEVEGRLPIILDGGPCRVGVESTVVDGVTNAGELRVLRPGGVGVEEIEDALRQKKLLQDSESSSSGAVRLCVYGKDMKRDSNEETKPTTPGMKYRHYSPDADVVLLVVHGQESKMGGPAPIPLQEAINAYISQHPQRQISKLRIGLMSMDDSKLTSVLFPRGSAPLHLNCGTSHLQRFSLGSQKTPEQAAQRLFEGLRALDEGKDGSGTDGCDVIFVEALKDEKGVGLAIMNRLEKAAGSIIHVEV